MIALDRQGMAGPFKRVFAGAEVLLRGEGGSTSLRTSHPKQSSEAGREEKAEIATRRPEGAHFARGSLRLPPMSKPLKLYSDVAIVRGMDRRKPVRVPLASIWSVKDLLR